MKQRASVPALRKSKSSASSGGSREGKNLRNTFPFNSAASAGQNRHHSNAAGNGRRASQGVASSFVSGLAPPAVGNNRAGVILIKIKMPYGINYKLW